MKSLHLVHILFAISCIPSAIAGMTERVDQNGVIYYSSEQSAHDVVMYAVPDCGYCRKARQYFSKQGIEYVEYNINKSSRRLKEFMRLGGRGTPLILIDGKVIQGFNTQAIQAALK
jgi:glutaredoxin